MNNEKMLELTGKAFDELLGTKGFVAPVEVLLKVGVVSQKDYSEWRRGKVLFLEKVCNVDISKVSMIMKQVKSLARKKNLKPSKTFYGKWGKDPKAGKGAKGAKGTLRFSKTGAKHIEDAYATHYVLKKAKSDVKSDKPKADPIIKSRGKRRR